MKKPKEILVGNRMIGGKNPVYIIAEIGLNHQGDVALAKQLIDIAVEVKCDCVKFQKRSLKNVYTQEALENPEKQEQGGGYIIDCLKKSELSDIEMTDLYGYCLEKDIDFLCSPWDEESLNFLTNLGVIAYKIASADMFNLKLIHRAVLAKKPIFISTGMSFLSEIEELVKFLHKIKAEYVLLHCNSTYPAPYQNLNLNFLRTMQDKFDCLVGYSGHERGISVSLAAVALGVKVIEKHLTLDRNMPGPDHKASLEPGEFKELIEQIRIIELALGESIKYPSRGEYLNREILSKSLVASRDLQKGTVLKDEDIAVKSPGKGVSPMKLTNFIGKELSKRNIKKDDYILETDVKINGFDTKDLDVRHKWGVVARMADVEDLLRCKSDFVEIRLTDSDVILDKNYSQNYQVDLVIHGPEYNKDLLLDLSSLDKDIRNKSISFFNQSLNHARKLKPLFRNQKGNVMFVVHPGGMSLDNFLVEKSKSLNHNLLDSLSKLDSDGFELLVENMPPLPWYFGGQWYQSSFIDVDEIVEFSKTSGCGIVFDVSHAALYCNFYQKDLEKFVQKILPVTKYLHIADAAKFNGEGLQIGDGSIDFEKILGYLVKTDLWFLMEVWQGHKFMGVGFIESIQGLKKINKEV